MSNDSCIRRHSMDILIPKHKIFVEGHRGINREFYQNTLDSFKQAIKYDIDSIELDIWLTKDKIPVVIHGGDKGELTDHVINIDKNTTVNSLLLSEIEKLKTKETEQRIPTLNEVLDLCKNKIFINIELKDLNFKKTFDKVVSLLEEKKMINQIAISSFYHEYFDIIKKYNDTHDEKIECGYLYLEKKDKDFKPYKYDTKNCSMNIYQEDVTKEIVEKAHKNGIAVMAWFNFTDKENDQIYKKLFDSGIDVICCNEANKAKILRDKLYNM